MPVPACSGSWQCDTKTGKCEMAPVLFPDVDKDGYNQLFQMDRDGDGHLDERAFHWAALDAGPLHR